MHRERLLFLLQEVLEEFSSELRCKEISLFHLENEIWLTQDNSPVPDRLSKLATEALDAGSYIQRDKTLLYYFPLQNWKAVFQLKASIHLEGDVCDRIVVRIRQCAKHANSRFAERYDALTGLLNRTGLELELQSWEPAPTDAANSTILPSDSAGMMVAVLALDLDHFKQVNDTYGHIYGDVVLECFARRLRELVRYEEGAFTEQQARLIATRMGGEEFSILVLGKIDKDWLRSFAEKIRERISEGTLPTSAEWDRCRSKTKEITLPQETERRITVSIGVAGLAVPRFNVSSLQDTLDKIKNRADAALYRAKASGRNQTCFFSDILNRYGRILEHHSDTDVVAIDLGKHVNVTFGMEFLVFHPDFYGKTAFYQNDGRSKKRIGTYPKYPCGRIAVFDVQAEMSFCNVLERKQAKFSAGYTLEEVPLGSISHLLLPTPAVVTHDQHVVSIEQFRSKFTRVENNNKRSAKENRAAGVAVFAIANVEEINRLRGIAFINTMLAELYQAIRETFSETAPITQITPTQFAVFSTNFQSPGRSDADISLPVDSFRQRVSDVLERAIKQRPQASLIAGMAFYDPKHHNIVAEKYLLVCALFAASQTLSRKSPIELFTTKTAEAIVTNSRNEGNPQKAIADYKTFKEMGIESAVLENQAALAGLAQIPEDMDTSLSAIRKCTDLSPDSFMFWYNRGLIEFFAGERLNAYDSFARGNSKAKSGSALPRHYLPIYAMSMYEMSKQESNDIDLKDLLTVLLDAQKERILRQAKMQKADLISAIKDVESRLQHEAS